MPPEMVTVALQISHSQQGFKDKPSQPGKLPIIVSKVCIGSVQLDTTVYNHERTKGVYVLYILMSSPAIPI